MAETEYYNPVQIEFGNNSLDKIAQLADMYSGNKNVLVVTGRNAMRKQGYTQRVEELLTERGYVVDAFERVRSNPTIEIVDEGLEIIRSKNYGLIVGMGGGSAMDCAKCMAILGMHEGGVLDYLKKEKKLEHVGVPLIEIPTTAGTGSEVTMWATVWDMKPGRKKKYSLANKMMYAKSAIVDPEVTLGLRPEITAMTGMDALCQAVEAYWSKNHNPTSDKHALKAIRLLAENLENLYKDPENVELRERIALGSLESGLAFSNTKTTAVHSTSYPITAHFGVPHGHACALTLGSFLKYNGVADDNMDEGPERVQRIAKTLDCENAQEAAEKLEQMMKNMNLATRLGELGIDEKGVDLIVREGFTPDRVKHNPRLVTEENLRKLLRGIL